MFGALSLYLDFVNLFQFLAMFLGTAALRRIPSRASASMRDAEEGGTSTMRFHLTRAALRSQLAERGLQSL